MEEAEEAAHSNCQSKTDKYQIDKEQEYDTDIFQLVQSEIYAPGVPTWAEI